MGICNACRLSRGREASVEMNGGGCLEGEVTEYHKNTELGVI